MKKFVKSNLSNIAFSFALAIVFKIFGDMTRTYAAFGGEEMVLIAWSIYWYLKYELYKEEQERLIKRIKEREVTYEKNLARGRQDLLPKI